MNGEQMRRRKFLALVGTTALSTLSLSAEQAPVIGFLSSESPNRLREPLRMFREGLRDGGFIEGQNVAIEYRWAEGQNDRLPALAADLVRLRVHVIAAPGTTPAALALKGATSAIPGVFFTGADPVALKLVASLNRPGGNLTGVTSMGGQLAPKRLELLRALMPTAAAMGLLVNPTNPVFAESTAAEVQQAASKLGVRLHILQAGAEQEFEPVFARLAQLPAAGLVIAVDSFFTGRREELGALALRNRIAAIYQYRDFAMAGGVMSYGGNLTEPYRIAGLYTARILKGEKPADLPVQQITKVELVVNMRSAKALGLNVPGNLLALADEVLT
jgi:putative tryptophan/tyrosine transport system substrate-binding protein